MINKNTILACLRCFDPQSLQKGVSLAFAGLKVPKGQYLAVSPYALHHDKRIWGDTVEDFIPERWLSNDPVQEKHCKQNFFAFGDGPRVCIGWFLRLANNICS